MDTVVCRSWAKINLYLDVLDRRSDGYTNIETVFQTVNLGDELVCTRTDQTLSIECPGSGLPHNDRNLALKAARLLRDRTGCEGGAHMRLLKRIPIAAGLAGGSGNAAAALLALNRLWQLGLSRDDLAALALELGSDVPYCLAGGTQAATGRGETLEPLPSIEGVWFVLVHPEIAISTAAVYASPQLERNHETPKNGRTPSFERALAAFEVGNFREGVFNRMATAVFPEHPGLAHIKDVLLSSGCEAAAMSGSGPTLFGLCRNAGDCNAAQRALPGYRSTVVSPVAEGVSFQGVERQLEFPVNDN